MKVVSLSKINLELRRELLHRRFAELFQLKL